MVWKTSRTRIANIIERLQIQKGELQLFWRACFRIILSSLFLGMFYYFLSIATGIPSLSCTLYEWHIIDLQDSLVEMCNVQLEKGLTVWQLPFFMHEIKKRYPYIQSYSITTEGIAGYSLFLWGYPLLCVVNKKSVMAMNGEIYLASSVKTESFDQLDHVFIEQNILEASEMKRFLNPLCHLTNKGWHITIVTPDCIKLYDDAYKKYVVACSIDSYDMCQRYRPLLGDMAAKSGVRIKKNQQLLFDMRFQNQIVVKAIDTRGGVI